MNLLLGIIGIILFAVVIVDVLQTTFFLTGTGLLSGQLSLGIWKLLLIIQKKSKKRMHRLLAYAGSSIILVNFFIWVVVFFFGITFIFHFSENSIINSRTGIASGFWEKLYYVGFSVTTLGIGDFIPGSKFWELFTIFSSVTGFFLLTIIITYLIPLISSVEEKRKFAAIVNNIGETPQEFLEKLKTEKSYNNLSNLLMQFLLLINSMTQKHFAYPALHYFHSVNLKNAAAPAVAVLDEALSIFIIAHPDNYKETSNIIIPLRNAILNFLVTLEDSFMKVGNEVPVLPEILLSENLNISTDSKKIKQFYAGIEKRRKLLLSYVKNDGWDWEDIIN